MDDSESSDPTRWLGCPVTLAVALTVAVIGSPSLTEAAGNVTVQQVRGELRIKGDDEANQIGLVSEGVGQFEVGVDPSGTINHITGGTFVAEGVRDIAVSLGGGDDVVILLDVFVPGNLRIDTGRGNDSINGQDSSAGALQIFTGRGDDTILWDGGTFGSLRICTGAGADQVALSVVDVTGDTFIDLGSGPDRFDSFVQTFGGRVKVAAGTGDDTIALDSSVFNGPAMFGGGGGSHTFDPGQSKFDGGITTKNFP